MLRTEGAEVITIPEHESAKAILKTLWPAVRPGLTKNGKLAMSESAWGRRYKRVALDLARNGFTPDEVLGAQRSASGRTGQPIYSLKIIQDEIARSGRPVGSGKSLLDEAMSDEDLEQLK